MKPRVFLDSGIMIAQLSKSDQWHAQAVALFDGPTPAWSTSALVIAEAYSWFLHRMGEQAARGFLEFVDRLTSLRILDATREHHERVKATLNRYRGARLTYVDASSLTLLDQHKIKRVWSTDYHLALSGAEILPRV